MNHGKYLLICLSVVILAAWTHGYTGRNFYVSPTGNDNNTGLTPESPWQTTTKVNSTTFQPGDNILFQGGQTFTGNLIATTSGSCDRPITYSSYGTGQAIISSGNVSGFKSNDQGGLTLDNLIFNGGGNLTTTVLGIDIDNSRTFKLSCISLKNNEIRNYGSFGVFISGSNPIAAQGFDKILLDNNTIHDVDGGGAFCCTMGCVRITRRTGAVPYLQTTHTNVIIRNNLVYNCTGIAGSASGSGIILANATTGVMEYNIVHDWGANVTLCGGAGGIWTIMSNLVTMQFNEVYNGTHGVGGCNDNGMDLDQNVTNAVMQYNWIHDTTGFGIIACTANFSGAPGFANNIIRYNLVQNANRGGFFICTAGGLTNSFVFNNVFYGPETSVGAENGGGSLGINFSNNVLWNTSLADTVAISQANIISFTNNTYPGTAKYNWSGTPYASFAAWQTATQQEKIGGVNVGLTSDPLFNSAGGGGITNGYNPSALTAYQYSAGSPMIGAGLNVQTQWGVATGLQDYYGDPIPSAHGSGYDIGAYVRP